MVTGTGTISTQSTSTGNCTGNTQSLKSDRRSNKPIMEKRRRARINNCLNELKVLILDVTKKDPARHSKLEKADILEKTVKHLQDLQRQQAAMSQVVDPKVMNKFKAGFAECANEVNRFPGIDTNVKRRLLQHLSNCINNVKSADIPIHRSSNIQPSTQSVQIHMLPSPPSSPEQDHSNQMIHHHSNHQIQTTLNGYYLPNGVQIIPTRLTNGNIALVLPQNISQTTQIPTLVPIPSRTSSTSSSTSIQSAYERISKDNAISSATFTPLSPANSYESMECQPSVIQHSSSLHQMNTHQYSTQHSYQFLSNSEDPAPLSLVVKKIKEEDQPWRPW